MLCYQFKEFFIWIFNTRRTVIRIKSTTGFIPVLQSLLADKFDELGKELIILYKEWNFLDFFFIQKTHNGVHDKIWNGLYPLWAMIKWWEKCAINELNRRFCGLLEIALAENEFG